MHALLKRLSLVILLVLLIAACANGKNEGTAAVIRNLQATNLDSSQFPWTYSLAGGRTKRWDIERDGLIPIKLNGSSLAQAAIQKIEAMLGLSLFDTTAIADLSDDSITRGIVVSEGTAVGPNGVVTSSTCGNVSALPATTAWPTGFYAADGSINTRLVVNLSSSKCTATLEIAIHEIGHALGLGQHFPGFGSVTAVISPSFWQVLYTLYHNEVGTLAGDLNITLPDQLLFPTPKK